MHFRSKSGEHYGYLDDEIQAELGTATPFQNIAGQKNVDDEMVFHNLLWPRPDLYIIGAGVMPATCRLAENVGYAVRYVRLARVAL